MNIYEKVNDEGAASSPQHASRRAKNLKSAAIGID
jgi:hypothetical protein